MLVSLVPLGKLAISTMAKDAQNELPGVLPGPTSSRLPPNSRSVWGDLQEFVDWAPQVCQCHTGHSRVSTTSVEGKARS
jgi:hypothetical protein